MKKIVVIFLLCCFLVPTSGTFIWLQHRRHAVRKEVKRKLVAGIDEGELVLLKFSEEDIDTKLHWKHDKEFEFNGEMYDIVTAKKVGDSIFYRCWWDHKETKLNKQLEALAIKAFNKDPYHKDKQQKLRSFFKTLYISYYSTETLVVMPTKRQQQCTYLQQYTSITLPLPWRPPILV